jgi:hypothetical protein
MTKKNYLPSMKRLRLILLAVCLTACTDSSTALIESTESGSTYVRIISPSLPLNRFEIAWENGEPQAIIVKRTDGSVVQTLEVPDTNIYSDLPDKPQNRRDFFVTEDLNFDGFKDLKLLNSYGAYSGTEIYNVWFFNPTKSLFTYQPVFEKIIAPEPDEQSRHILSYGCGRSLCDEHLFQIYGYEDGQLILLREEEIGYSKRTH